jgi:aryl-alcohol dehydrogenase-like predicted oxidoreductase
MTAFGPNRFAFGAMQFGSTASAADAAELYAACRAAGITHFDTAHAYTNGASERLLGDLVRPERAAVFVATKAGYVGGSSRQNILSTFDESRQRLQLDHVDLLYLHRFDDATPLEETFETLAKLQSDGLITHIGVSNFAAWQVMKAQAVAAKLGTSISHIQPMYNLVKRQAEVEILPMAQAEGLVPCTYSPLGGGLLTGKYSADAQTEGRLATDHRYAARYGLPQMHKAAQDLAALAADLGVHPATLAVAWVLQHPAAPLPILSARNAAQLAPSLAAINYALDAETYAKLQALFPAPPPATDRIEEV